MFERTKIIGVNGRVAFTAPRGGVRVPHDRAIAVPKTRWIEQRIDVGDIKEVGAAKTVSATENPVKPVRKTETDSEVK